MNGHFDFGGITPGRYFFSIAFLLGLLFALVSAEQDRSVMLVFLQWQLQTLLPMALLIGVHLALATGEWFGRLNPWLALSISGVLGASLFVPLALVIEVWLDRPPAEGIGVALLEEWGGVTPPVAICWLALNAPWVLGYRLQKTAPGNDRAPVVEAPEFMSLLPSDKRGRLLWMKAELHYLRVVTDRGQALVLYNLGDAIAQLPDDLGVKAHRSYWVAMDAVEAFARHGREGELRLRDGSRVPVSRRRLAEVRRRMQA